MRVQIPAYTDAWMRGKRFGEVVKVTRAERRRAGVRAALLTEKLGATEIATVRLDHGGLVKVILDDCTIVE